MVLALAPERSDGQARVGPTIQRIPREKAVEQDVVRFTNGDVLTGEIEEIAERVITLNPEMGENSLTIPIGAVKEVVFKNGEKRDSFPGDRVILVNGESLIAMVQAMKEDRLFLRLPSAQAVEMDLGNVAAIAFYRGKEVLAEEEFEGDLPTAMTFEKGRWRTQKGWLLQSDSRATECLASLPVTQTGTLTYEWTVNTAVGRSTGLYFMASEPGLSQERAYFVRVLSKYVYVYLCMNGEEVYCGSYRTSSYRSRNEVRLECDADRGFIEVWIDEAEVGRWHSSVPIKLGKYVVLRADGRAAFDSFRVSREEGAARPDVKSSEGGNVFKFINGDRIVGEMTGISERFVSFTRDEGKVTGQIEKEKLLYVGFDKEITQWPRGAKGTVVFVTWTGDRISGELLWLKGDVARIKSDMVGMIDLRRSDVGKVIFQEFP
jgi:hypothetical protein